ncbi:hypothetical protein YC2023_116781 [Brassica napus]
MESHGRRFLDLSWLISTLSKSHVGCHVRNLTLDGATRVIMESLSSELHKHISWWATTMKVKRLLITLIKSETHCCFILLWFWADLALAD